MVTIVRDRVRDMVGKDKTLEQVKAARPTRDYDTSTMRSLPTLLWRRSIRASPVRRNDHATLGIPRHQSLRGARRTSGPGTAKDTLRAGGRAQIDLTGYWVSVVSEDWRWRMVTPAKGDFASIPFTPEGKRVGEAWDPAADEASGDVCKAYGAAAIMRLPGRLHITWQDESTLKIETDTGMQTRLLHFGGKAPET
jgi:hypothetical protein